VIETDHWFGPLITNIRLIKTDMVIDFRQEHPMLQVQRCLASRTRSRR